MKSIARENGGGVGKSCLDLARTVTHFETHYKFFLKLCLVTNEKKNVVPTNVGLMHHKKGSFHQIKTSTKPFFKNVMVQYFQIQKYSHLFTSFQCHSNQFVAHFFFCLPPSQSISDIVGVDLLLTLLDHRQFHYSNGVWSFTIVEWRRRSSTKLQTEDLGKNAKNGLIILILMQTYYYRKGEMNG